MWVYADEPVAQPAEQAQGEEPAQEADAEQADAGEINTLCILLVSKQCLNS